MQLERTTTAQADFDNKTGEIPVVKNGAALDPRERPAPEAEINWGDDADEPLACGIENPDMCESCM